MIDLVANLRMRSVRSEYSPKFILDSGCLVVGQEPFLDKLIHWAKLPRLKRCNGTLVLLGLVRVRLTLVSCSGLLTTVPLVAVLEATFEVHFKLTQAALYKKHVASVPDANIFIGEIVRAEPQLFRQSV